MLVNKTGPRKFQGMLSARKIQLHKGGDGASKGILPEQWLTTRKLWVESTASTTHRMAQSPIRQRSLSTPALLSF